VRKFFLIGKPLNHSFSPAFFQEKFFCENILDSSYHLFPLNNLGDLLTLIDEHSDVDGLNVTIPYKRSIIEFLDELDPIAKKIGAVNTIKVIRSSKGIYLKGYNTDAVGFQCSCLGLRRNIKAIVMGTGGSAKAITFVLDQMKIPYISVSRAPKESNEIGYKELNETLIKRHLLIINTTPVGMVPDIENYPKFPFQYLSPDHFLFDLIYNPAETQFLKKGRQMGASIQNGQLMLELQAERSWEIWNS